ncbi:flagellar filament capping protein FliD [Halomonas campisalis]|uniref:Flagellar hook-associated protein 2 n=1 Tax=Billgrantia campisalis TaxID=74661 RepID=A0ABS9P582_9GAMM|nr:flagellar filament capping protein FliD [Halomonas campisalis]MCG6656235.1 flagellar filament capping protein FliD [Halomonas campisalis]MDR5861422.1 flagellar filament capping protein FliD [Halomonas campisalis]
MAISALGVGSGLDLTGLLNQLNAAERQKLQPIVTQKTQEQAKISAFGRLQSGLDKFQSAVAKLNDAELFSSLSTSVRGEGVTASAGDGASAGRYEVSVTHTARAGSLATEGVAGSDDPLVGVGGGSVTLEVGGQALDPINLAEGDTLVDIRDAINAQGDSGVRASIINDGSENGYRLVLNSTETGEAASITGITFDNVGVVEDTDSQVAGRDALLEINGISITSASNRVEGAIQGITLELDSAAQGKTATVVVEQDSETLKEAVQEFVSAYNEMKSTVGRMTNVTGDAETAGELVGNRAVRTIETRLSRDLGALVEGGEFRMLLDFGISLRPNGRLELDEAKLDDAVANNSQALADFFAGADKESGMAGRLDVTLGQILGDTGLVKSSIEGSENRVKSLETRFERMEQSIERTIERYRRQFGQLDGMMARMNATSAYLGQQLDMLAQMNNQRK